ncbi:hypothetical protein K435DRAFT_186724 [Dendrothele bispora CBS 962.96]|uniref:Uncharacterized protein n=1 Tax=Dendrothele bispora (strain CBS 962.96) TaxID=1314807 RepID=A0A4S8MNG2_DENBC|nr:hypothetical protein K435DRAFT_186724 [Dendrothele bispora CBS 962.96]
MRLDIFWLIGLAWCFPSPLSPSSLLLTLTFLSLRPLWFFCPKFVGTSTNSHDLQMVYCCLSYDYLSLSLNPRLR